jgi:rhodanese-related sulfurtransferase
VGVRNIDVNALKADLDRGAVPLLLDVRSPEEFGAGHVLGAKNMPMETVAQHLAEFPPDGGEVYVICARGGRSASTSAMLSENGIHPVNVEGGMTAWVSAGLPVEK